MSVPRAETLRLIIDNCEHMIIKKKLFPIVRKCIPTHGQNEVSGVTLQSDFIYGPNKVFVSHIPYGFSVVSTHCRRWWDFFMCTSMCCIGLDVFLIRLDLLFLPTRLRVLEDVLRSCLSCRPSVKGTGTIIKHGATILHDVNCESHFNAQFLCTT